MKEPEYITRVVNRILELAPMADEIFLCTASCSPKVIRDLSDILNCKKKEIIFGMFNSSENFLSVDVPKLASSLGWTVGLNDRLHAKLAVLKIGREYFVILGSANLSYSNNLEISIELKYKKLPDHLKALMGELRKDIKTKSDLEVRAPRILLKGRERYE